MAVSENNIYMQAYAKSMDHDKEAQKVFLKVSGDTVTTFLPDKEDVCDVPLKNIIYTNPISIFQLR